MKQYRSNSTEETENIGKKIGESLRASGVRRVFLALFGEMGVGKTAFCRGVCEAVAPGAAVRSPTYTVVNEYPGKPVPVFHFDMYRIADADDLYSVGFTDYLARDGIILCEWSERIRGEIPADALFITLSRAGDKDGRIITVEGESHENLID